VWGAWEGEEAPCRCPKVVRMLKRCARSTQLYVVRIPYLVLYLKRRGDPREGRPPTSLPVQGLPLALHPPMFQPEGSVTDALTPKGSEVAADTCSAAAGLREKGWARRMRRRREEGKRGARTREAMAMAEGLWREQVQVVTGAHCVWC